MEAKSALKYIVEELGVKLGELQTLSKKDREDLKEYAHTEMAVRGIPVR